MCGIVAITSEKPFSVKSDLLFALKKLEYRGYDSSGFATSEGIFGKEIGEIGILINATKKDIITKTAISHTRWATHGGVTKNNAHPHYDEKKELFLVHNGIIENFQVLKANLEAKGYKFATETDSEVIVNYLHDKLKFMKPLQAIGDFMREAVGTYAVVFIHKGDSTIWAMKKDSPLCLGVSDGRVFVASDIYAFSHATDKVVFFEDYEIAEVKPEGFNFYNLNGPITKKPVSIEWEREPVLIQHFDHFLLKEIHEQPAATRRLLQSLRTLQAKRMAEIAEMVSHAKRILFLACGSSYHASLIGSYLLSRLGFEAHAVIASEFEGFSVIDKDTVVFAVSQSGETMDVISVLKDIKRFGPKIVAVVNYPYSSIHRMADKYLEIMAGQEISVAATKTFTNTLLTLYELARVLRNHIELDRIPTLIEKVINDNEERVIALAKKLKDKRDIFILGNKVSYPIAREIALKLKEVSYVHAEGMMAGELKHGTIALIEPGVPVIGLVHETNHERMDSALREVSARGADVYTIGNCSNGSSTNFFLLPDGLNEEEYSIMAPILGHLLTYHIARLKGLPIDKPRNLAKSVTVK